VQLSIDQIDALVNADQSVMALRDQFARRSGRHEAATIILQPHSETRPIVAHGQCDVLRGGVMRNVSQRFLDDSIDIHGDIAR
jgi:hypothetical protein